MATANLKRKTQPYVINISRPHVETNIVNSLCSLDREVYVSCQLCFRMLETSIWLVTKLLSHMTQCKNRPKNTLPQEGLAYGM
jgi:hypothetical protein